MDNLKLAVHYFASHEAEFDAGIDDRAFELLMFLVLGFKPSKEALNATVQTSTPDTEETKGLRLGS
jgi:hypothetical protein